eukprot:CAMPEP_0181179328 /NCGR_PEP_ID=MMETSP1096-20121128/6204_1 /TAXON_ID=156174 ORGANISM="Chrysochromulina ericina, Strain CCMP281" /NCGR_SAMPLE_ID=MMETSP1096 /ASSEMBLY_ACC=CAM_ASM_000453 /LENGTH=31 /DNA_ID= /DNA_START= /DNA_END= /DNA_ORIENTATION=
MVSSNIECPAARQAPAFVTRVCLGAPLASSE